MNLRNKTVLITGGTGSLGRAIVERLLSNQVGKVIVFSRGEFAQVGMRRALVDKRVRYFIGDVREYKRLYRALKDVDIIIHTAALKHIDVCEYNPAEAVKTNVLGSLSLIDAAIDRGVKKVLAISSDKAINPTNLYGATKLCSDKLMIDANNYSGRGGPKFSVIRFGNFAGSDGSVIPYFTKLKDEGMPKLPIMDFRMTRWFITMDQAVDFTLEALGLMGTMKTGKIFAPKMGKLKIVDLARAIHPDAQLVEVGRRPGEKLHEELVSEPDCLRMQELPNFWVVGAEIRKRNPKSIVCSSSEGPWNEPNYLLK
jgi:UDP-N-acetylglucosamine 4,6-dehydratase